MHINPTDEAQQPTKTRFRVFISLSHSLTWAYIRTHMYTQSLSLSWEEEKTAAAAITMMSWCAYSARQALLCSVSIPSASHIHAQTHTYILYTYTQTPRPKPTVDGVCMRAWVCLCLLCLYENCSFRAKSNTMCNVNVKHSENVTALFILSLMTPMIRYIMTMCVFSPFI